MVFGKLSGVKYCVWLVIITELIQLLLNNNSIIEIKIPGKKVPVKISETKCSN